MFSIIFYSFQMQQKRIPKAKSSKILLLSLIVKDI